MWGISYQLRKCLLAFQEGFLSMPPFSVAQRTKSGLDRRIVKVYTSHTIRHTHTHTHTHTHAHTYTHTHTHTQTRTYTHTHTHTYKHIHTHTHTHRWDFFEHLTISSQRSFVDLVSVRVYAHLFQYAYMNINHPYIYRID